MAAGIWEADSKGNPVGDGFSATLQENTFFHFDAEAVQALSHAIEELALEEASGSLAAAIQHFSDFDQFRERFWQLGATLEKVQVFGRGQPPRRHGHASFIKASDSLGAFWIVLFQGRHSQVLLCCRQTNAARLIEERRYAGFYSLEPNVVEEAKQQLLKMAKGHLADLPMFSRVERMDQAGKELAKLLGRHQRTLSSGLEKLKVGSGQYHAVDFLSDLDNTLNELSQWKHRLPGLISGPNP